MKRNIFLNILVLVVLLFGTINSFGQIDSKTEQEQQTITMDSFGQIDSKTEQEQQTITMDSFGQIGSAIEQEPQTGTINGYEYVDLGLSVKWATCNLGAEFPADYGYYYAWGETGIKSTYTDKNSVTRKKKMGDIAGDPSYDPATASWDSPWRLPTIEEIQELKKKCKWTWTTRGGHNGYKITGPNGNSIFLPAAGYCYESSNRIAGDHGLYWTSSPDGSNTQHAIYFGFSNSNFYWKWHYRSFGLSVRPVSE